jgi:hypothetical protein
MGKHSMMVSTKSIRATRTDTPAIIQSWKKSGAGYNGMAAALDGALTIVPDAIFARSVALELC